MSPSDTASVESAPKKVLKFITCPHCWQRFQTCDIAWVARHEDLRGDSILGTDEFLRFMPTRFNVKCEALDARGMACQALACPRCHLTVPRMFLHYEPIIFSLIGVPASGKSYFLTAMTWELGRILPTEFGLVFNDVDPYSNLTLKEYQKTLFLHPDQSAPVGIAKTQADSTAHYNTTMLDGQHTLQPRPLLFCMRPLREHPHAAESEELTRIVGLYDNAGEYFLPGPDAVISPSTLHMAHSRVLLFLYDPSQDPRFRERCLSLSQDPQLTTHAHTQLQSSALIDAAARIRQHGHLAADKRLDQPLIVLVTKSDIWSGLLDEDVTREPLLPRHKPYRNVAALDGARVHAVSRAIRKLMAEVAPEFVGVAEDACREVIYMPVSSLGCSPMPGESQLLLVKPEQIRPRWVTVPLLYAFARYASGVIGATWQ